MAIVARLAGREYKAVTLEVRFLTRTQAEDGFWKEERFTATVFPRVFFLRYPGYAKYFPLWAMARFASMRSRAAVTPWVLHAPWKRPSRRRHLMTLFINRPVSSATTLLNGSRACNPFLYT
jgi:hypothetical protein